MDKLVVLKHENGKYYSDGEFIEPEKKFAEKLKFGRAIAIKRRNDRIACIKSADDSKISIEEV